MWFPGSLVFSSGSGKMLLAQKLPGVDDGESSNRRSRLVWSAGKCVVKAFDTLSFLLPSFKAL